MAVSTTTTLIQPPLKAPPQQITNAHNCDKCGTDLTHAHPGIADDAQRRISELETQVKILTGKATAAVDKLADYEDELRQLKTSTSNITTTTTTPPSRPSSTSGIPPTPTTQPPQPPQTATGLRPGFQSRFSALLPTSNRRSASQPSSPAPPEPATATAAAAVSSADLLALLTREQTLRQAAESRVSQTNEELEELSAQLFTEANEMVATERKARVKLEERVRVLEERESGRRVRLERLEERMARIERVRTLLAREGGKQG